MIVSFVLRAQVTDPYAGDYFIVLTARESAEGDNTSYGEHESAERLGQRFPLRTLGQ